MTGTSESRSQTWREWLPAALRWLSACALILLYILYSLQIGGVLPEGIGTVLADTRTMFVIVLTFIVAYGAEQSVATRRLREEVSSIGNNLRESAAADLRMLERFVDPRLMELFTDRIPAVFAIARGCLKGEMLIERDFPVYYWSILQRFPRARFLAIASADEDIWGTSQLYDHMKAFIAGGGHIERLFAVVNPDKLTDMERTVIDQHVACGVSVRVFNRQLADARVQPFIVEEQGRILLTADVALGHITAIRAIVSGDASRAALEAYVRLSAFATSPLQAASRSALP